MSRRVLVVLGTAAGMGALAVTALAVAGSSAPGDSASDRWAGWTGRVDTASVSDRAAMTPDDAVAVSLLRRASKASTTVAYSGRAVATTRGTTTSTDLVHVPGRGTLATTTGQPSSAARLAADGRSGSFADAGRQLDLLRVNYRVLRQADLDTTVAGRPADAVVAVDADGTEAARYWLDHATGLLLRKELVAASGVWSRAGFTELRFGEPSPASLPTQAPSAWSGPLSADALRAARQAGCACPDALPGGLTLLDARQAEAGTVAAEPVVQQLFSDGLESVSLFSLAGAIDESDAQGLRDRGFVRTELDGHYAWVRGATSTTATVVWDCQGSVLTLVTDDAADPLETASAVLAAFPPDPEAADGSLLARVQRGWDRLTGRTS